MHSVGPPFQHAAASWQTVLLTLMTLTIFHQMLGQRKNKGQGTSLRKAPFVLLKCFDTDYTDHSKWSSEQLSAEDFRIFWFTATNITCSKSGLPPWNTAVLFHLGAKLSTWVSPEFEDEILPENGNYWPLLNHDYQQDTIRSRQLLTLLWLSFLPFSSPKIQYCENRLNQPTPDIFHQLYENNTNVKISSMKKTFHIL